MNLFYEIFFIFVFNFIFCYAACGLFDDVCKLNYETLECDGKSKSTELQTFSEIFQSKSKITKLNLINSCLVAGNLDVFDSLEIFEFHFDSLQLSELDENIFSEKLGSTLLELILIGHFSFSNSSFKYLIKLNKLTFMSNVYLKSMLSKEFFSESLSNLTILNINYTPISHFNGDMFINLKSLEYLKLYYNYIKEFPKAIEFIPSLKSLLVQDEHGIEYLEKPFKTILPNLEFIELSRIQSLIAIEDCAFCNFPNLKTLYLGYSTNLTWIHGNAFGDLLLYNDQHWGHRVENLETFNIVNCNVSVLPEHLLNWSKLENIYLGGNKFICNCSNAWLIEDIQSSNPVFSDNIKRYFEKGYKSELECHGPESVKGKLLKEISTVGCKEMICEKTKPPETYGFFSGVLSTVLVMFFIALIVFRNRVKGIYQRLQHTNSESINLQEYTNP